jgi:hypothetical protein
MGTAMDVKRAVDHRYPMLRRDINRVPTPTFLVSMSVRRMIASDVNIPGGSDSCSASMIAFHEASITETRDDLPEFWPRQEIP